MKRKLLTGLLVVTILLLTSCSSNSNESADNANTGNTDNAKYDAPTEESSSKSGNANGVSNNTSDQELNLTNQDDKMIIYNANITLETEDYDVFNENLEKLIFKHEGYIVESSLQKRHNDNRFATITLRVPKNSFYPFVHGLNEFDVKINTNNISGEDVTKQYVDLTSRLSAKQKIENRLLSFLDQAEKTEDLIAISKDLERVQEEIELIQGKMNYLKNQSEFSTITLRIEETKVIVPELENKELNTWQKTKQTFMNSINGMTKFFSMIFIAAIGYSPILIFLAILFLIIIIGKKVYRKRSSDDDNDNI